MGFRKWEQTKNIIPGYSEAKNKHNLLNCDPHVGNMISTSTCDHMWKTHEIHVVFRETCHRLQTLFLNINLYLILPKK